jgi:hypothetical protein
MKWILLALMLASSPALADSSIWNDVTRQHRDDAALNADGHICDAQVGADVVSSRAYKRCMRAHGWALQRVIREPPEKTWIDPDTGDTCRDLKVNGTVIGSSCGNF